jgi:hypothetical protein
MVDTQLATGDLVTGSSAVLSLRHARAKDEPHRLAFCPGMIRLCFSGCFYGADGVELVSSEPGVLPVVSPDVPLIVPVAPGITVPLAPAVGVPALVPLVAVPLAPAVGVPLVVPVPFVAVPSAPPDGTVAVPTPMTPPGGIVAVPTKPPAGSVGVATSPQATSNRQLAPISAAAIDDRPVLLLLFESNMMLFPLVLYVVLGRLVEACLNYVLDA